MEVNFSLRMVIVTFLAVIIAGCGNQIRDPVMQEENYDSLEGMPAAFMAAFGTEAPDGPYLNFRFRVEIDGIVQAGFWEVIMPDAKVGTAESKNRKRPKTHTEYGNLILMWGVTSNMELYDWFKSTTDGDEVRKNLSVVLMDEQGSDVARWNFIDALPVRYDAPDLNALGSDVAIETLEISFGSMTREY